MQLFVFCEGQTEETFSNVVLAPHFASLGAFVQPLLLPNVKGAHARRHKGGWNSYQTARHFMHGIMQQHHRDGTWFTTMYDYYALPGDYPISIRSTPTAPREKVTVLEKLMAQELVTDALWRFTPHLQLHEFEALLLVDIDAFGEEFPERFGEVASLKGDVRGIAPEDVNDGPNTHPAARIIRRIPEYEGRKASAGPILAAHIGLVRLRQSCPHFAGWISLLERHITGAAREGPT
jgi:hypothetical protein